MAIFRFFARWALGGAALVATVVGCGGGSPSMDDMGTYGTNPPTALAACTRPAPGCSCTTPGASTPCGRVDRISGNYVSCSMGAMACSGGVWGACIGDRITTKVVSGAGLHALNYGVAGGCTDLCDPLCNQTNDTPSQLDAGSDSGLSTNDSGGFGPVPVIPADGGVPCTGLAISPSTLNLTVTGLTPIATSPATATMTASYTPPGCYSGNANASWSLDRQDRAAIAGGVLTPVSAVAGPINVTAYSAGFQASSVVNITTTVVDSSQVTPAVAAQFNGGGAGADNIKVLYPYAKTVFPRGIGAPVVQWDNLGVPATAAKVTIRYPAAGTATYSVSVILPESTPPQAALGQDAWAFLDATAAGQDALVSIQRLVAGVLRTPVTETVHFAVRPLRGKIFYTEYNNNAWTAAIKSAVPSGTAPSKVAVVSSGCGVCHSVAANGSTMVSSNWGGNNTSVLKVNADGTLTGLANMWNNTGTDSRGFAYSAITPDGMYALQGSNWWGNTVDSWAVEGAFKPHNNGWGLTGTYYPNTTLTGAGALVRTDPTVDFNWGNTSPGSGIVAGSNYSVSWTGFIQPIFTETYTFESESSDGVKLWVNGTLLINKWGAQADTKFTGTIALTRGVKVPIILQYENVSKTAQVHLRWSSASQPYQIVPVTQLYPAASAASTSGLYGTYYSNMNLTGSTKTEVDPTVNFNWNGQPPITGMAATQWSAEWTGSVKIPCTDNYLFCVTGDDGVRLWVDGVKVDDGWFDQGPTTYCNNVSGATIHENAGTSHTIKMDYYQDGGGSVAQLSWNSACTGNQIIPVTALSQAVVPPASVTGLTGTYYSNIDFTGTAVTEIDPRINFNWNGSSPQPGIGGANWSAQWSGQVTIPCTDNYEFCTESDDGTRLWVDNALLVDNWRDQGGASWYCSNLLPETAGSLHDIKLDYYQRAAGSSMGLWWWSSCNGWNLVDSGLHPTGDQGLGGYDKPVSNAGDNGTGVPYSIFQLPTAVNSPVVDVSAQSANAWGLGTTTMMVPTFSPDGTKLVFVDGDTSAGATWRQGLSVFDFNEASKMFSNRRSIVNAVGAGNIVRWPTVESDSQSVIYQTNPTSADNTQYGGMLPSGYSSIPGQLWSVDMTNPVGHPPVTLDAINAGLGGVDQNLSYQASVLPTAAGGYRWTVFTSTRQYGNTMNIPTAGVTTSTQLWVAALDDAVSTGTDRSHPPFWLPNQLLGSSANRLRNERAYWVLDACRPSLANLNPPPPPSGPTFNWVDRDIGTVGSAGSASASGGVFTVVASGDDIWNSNDAFHYVYMPVSGDFQFRARVTSLNMSDYWAKAGVMLRDNLSSNSAEAMMLLNAGQGTSLQWRDPNGAGSNYTTGPSENFPFFVRLTRTGTTVVGDISADGTNWTTVGTLTPSIGTNAYIGLAVTAHNNTTTTTATFDTVGFGAVPAPDPRIGSLCQDDSDCCGAIANPATAACRVDTPITNPVTRHCMLLQANSCVALGGACVSDTDCCGFPSNTCGMGTCQPPPSPLRYPEIVFTRDYVASCPAQTKPVWRFFDWQTVTPSDSSIKFSAASAATSGGLPSSSAAASVVYLGTASGAPITSWVGADVGAAFVAAKQYTSYSYLRIFVDFKPSSDGKQGPALTAWRDKYDCVAAE